MKQFARQLAVCIGIAVAVSTSAKADEFVNILSGGTSGTYYPIGVGLSNIMADKVPGVKPQVQVTKGSVENITLLQQGRGEFGLATGDSLSLAWSGNSEAGYTQPFKKLRGIAAIFPTFIHVVASKDSGIKSLADLKGKRVSVGAAKSGTELNSRAVLSGAGLSYKDLGKVEYLGFAETVELLKNRQIDASLQTSGLGVASIKELSTAIDMSLIGVPADVVAKIGDAAYQPSIIPANTYQGQSKDIPTAVIWTYLVAQESVKDDLVYQMTKAMFANADQLAAVHAAGKSLALQTALTGMPIPLHPGAERFYREQGLLKQ